MGVDVFLQVEVLAFFPIHGIYFVAFLLDDACSTAFGSKWIFIAFVFCLLVQNGIGEALLVAVACGHSTHAVSNIQQFRNSFCYQFFFAIHIY